MATAKEGGNAMTHDGLAFGITVDQIDQFNSLLRTVTANGDMVAVSSAEAVHAQTVSTLGEAIFNAALAMREILDQIDGQRIFPEESC
jgi:hypothetical protein